MRILILLFPLTLFASLQTTVEEAAPSEEVRQLWCELVQNGYVERCGSDADVRPLFVTLRGVFEQQLALELGCDIEKACGIIHTPMPTTPLCTKGEISPYLVDPSIERDPERLKTVTLRTTTLRDFLHKGGGLIVAYPKGGLEKRTKEQQEIYCEELARYPELIDMPLKCEEMPHDLIGATYFLHTSDGCGLFFSIKMTQANDPSGDAFGLWFGGYDNPCIVERFKRVSTFLEENRA